MQNSSVILLTSLALVAIGTLLMLNLGPHLSTFPTTTPGMGNIHIKAIDLYKKGLFFPLNAEQQKIVAEAITHAEPVKKSDYPEAKGPLNFEKLIIHRYDGPDIEIHPLQYKDSNLVFSTQGLSKDGDFIEFSAGALQKTLDSAHD